MAGATSVQALDICRLCRPGCRQGLPKRNPRPLQLALRWKSSRATLREGVRSELSARSTTNHSTRYNQQRPAESCSSRESSCCDSSVPSVKSGSRRAALLLGGTFFLTKLSNMSVSTAEAQAAAEKLPIVEEVPEFVKGKFPNSSLRCICDQTTFEFACS